MPGLIDILFPVVAIIAAGYGAARRGWIDAPMTRGLADLTFLLLAPALLFRAMALTKIDQISFSAPLAYFGAAVPIFIGIVIWRWRTGHGAASAAVYALAATFSNTVMLGVPLMRLAHGEAGLTVLLMIVMLHSIIMLTAATFVLELGRALTPTDGQRAELGAAMLSAVRSSLLHPMILPIMAGTLWGVLGWPLPGPVDAALDMLGTAAPPLCLVLLGASLSQFGFRAGLKDALRFAAFKNVLHPLGVYAIGRWLLDLDPFTLSVATLAAALPIGNNVYLFAQRYGVERESVASGVLVSTLACGLTLPALLTMLRI